MSHWDAVPGPLGSNSCASHLPALSLTAAQVPKVKGDKESRSFPLPLYGKVLSLLISHHQQPDRQSNTGERRSGIAWGTGGSDRTRPRACQAAKQASGRIQSPSTEILDGITDSEYQHQTGPRATVWPDLLAVPKEGKDIWRDSTCTRSHS